MLKVGLNWMGSIVIDQYTRAPGVMLIKTPEIVSQRYIRVFTFLFEYNKLSIFLPAPHNKYIRSECIGWERIIKCNNYWWLMSLTAALLWCCFHIWFNIPQHSTPRIFRIQSFLPFQNSATQTQYSANSNHGLDTVHLHSIMRCLLSKSIRNLYHK